MKKLLKIPFLEIDPAKSPVFYGYVILVIGSIGVFCSIPGQTIGVSVFTDPVKDALGLSRNQFSNAYLIGTVLSSLIIGRAGKWFDRYGARLVAFCAALTLATALLLASWSAAMSTFIKELFHIESWIIPFIVMTILFFFLRFSGQGVLTMSSRNMIMIWFDQYRGRINAISSVAISLGFSSSPLWIDTLIENFGWQNAWKLLGLGLLCFSLLVYLFYKNSPEAHGLMPDGALKKIDDVDPKVIEKKQFTLTEAKKTRAFWMYGLTLAFFSFFSTGLTFHIVSIFESQGFSKDAAIAIFLPSSIIAVSVSLVFNFLSDYLSLRLYLYLLLLGGAIASFGLLMLAATYGATLLILGLGIMSGFFAVLNAVAWPRFFGRTHLGAITGRIMSFLVLASALAPSIFSFCFSNFKSYQLLGYFGLFFLSFLVIGSIQAKNPQK